MKKVEYYAVAFKDKKQRDCLKYGSFTELIKFIETNRKICDCIMVHTFVDREETKTEKIQF